MLNRLLFPGNAYEALGGRTFEAMDELLEADAITMTGLSAFAGKDLVLADEDVASKSEKQYSETDGAATLDWNHSQKMDSLNASTEVLSDG